VQKPSRAVFQGLVQVAQELGTWLQRSANVSDGARWIGNAVDHTTRVRNVQLRDRHRRYADGLSNERHVRELAEVGFAVGPASRSPTLPRTPSRPTLGDKQPASHEVLLTCGVPYTWGNLNHRKSTFRRSARRAENDAS